jgi:diaminohydroxyphosphoribosylaminopyrimidine deaminase/5-amino-6-(5-phosphoribosylamino)uracil reductase
LKEECLELNKRFFAFHTKKRPFIVLKFAKTNNGFIGKTVPSPCIGGEENRLFISNSYTNKLVHQWRSEEAAILVGTNTALKDNPQLNNRLGKGNQPIRLVIDQQLKLPQSLHLFNQQQPTVVFNRIKNDVDNAITYVQLNEVTTVLSQIMEYCYQQKIQSILVEGGAVLLQHFIDENLWDEARIITNEKLLIEDGIAAPIISGTLQQSTHIFDDRIDYYTNKLHD